MARKEIPQEAPAAPAGVTPREAWLSDCLFDLTRLCETDAKIAQHAHLTVVSRLTCAAARAHYGRERLAAGEVLSFPPVELAPADHDEVAIIAARNRAARDLLARLAAEDGKAVRGQQLATWACTRPDLLERLGAAGFLRFNPPASTPGPIPGALRHDRLARDPDEGENVFDGRAAAAGR